MEEAFEYAAIGLNDTMVDLEKVRPRMDIAIRAEGHDIYSLLFDWLDKVMLLLVADGIVLSQFKVKISRDKDYSLEAAARGEKLDLSRHNYKVEIKAVTYHEMEIKEEGHGVTVRYLLDL